MVEQSFTRFFMASLGVSLLCVSIASAASHTIPVHASVTSGPTPPAPCLSQQSSAGLTATPDTSTVSQEALARGATWNWSADVYSRLTASGQYQSASSGHTVAMNPPGGQSTTLTATFTLPAYWKINATVTVTYSDGTDTWTGQDTVPVNLKAVQVGLSASEIVEYSLVTPGYLCLNAQDTYKSAKWQATVLPAGTTATVVVEQLSADVTLSTGSVSNDQEFTVNGGKSPGSYTLAITHNENSGCTAEAEGVAFKILIKVDDPAGSGSTQGPKPDNDAGQWYVKATAVAAAQSKGGADQTCVRHAWLETEPAEAYSGHLKTTLAFTQKIVDKATSSGYGVKVVNLRIAQPTRTYTLDFQIAKWAATFPPTTVFNDSAGFSYKATISGPNGATQELPGNLATLITPFVAVTSDTIPNGTFELKASVNGSCDVSISERIDATHPQSVYTVGDKSSCAVGFVEMSAACASWEGTPNGGAWADAMFAPGNVIDFSAADAFVLVQ